MASVNKEGITIILWYVTCLFGYVSVFQSVPDDYTQYLVIMLYIVLVLVTTNRRNTVTLVHAPRVNSYYTKKNSVLFTLRKVIILWLIFQDSVFHSIT